MSSDLKSIASQFDKVNKYIQKKEKEASQGIERNMYAAAIRVQSEVQKTIRAYNRGEIERYPGDLVEREERGYNNNPLKDTGMMAAAISIDVKKEGNLTTGRVIFNTKYAKWLNDGTENISAYRFKEIAYVLSEEAVKKILKIGVV